MIFVRDKGRMCNNLLQYGHVYAWAREHGRRTVSMRFAYKYPYFHIGDTAWHNFAVYALAKYGAKIGLLPVAGFHSPEGNPEAQSLLERRRWLVVEGWEVRYYDLFLKYKQEILQLFAFKDSVRRRVEETLRQGGGADGLRLGIHIRRGDYSRWNGGKYFFDDEVYIDYIRRFASQHPDRKLSVYICGNDPTLDREKFRHALPGMAVSFPDGNPGEDLCLLSECDWLIGAPSTFSLVASMYHDRPLCWMMAPLKLGETPTFGYFDHLFKHIL